MKQRNNKNKPGNKNSEPYDLDAALLHTSGSKVMVFNFLKSISLIGASMCLNKNTEQDTAVANAIMEDVIDGYAFEDHSIQ